MHSSLILFGCCFPPDLFFNNFPDDLQRNLLEMCFRLEHKNFFRITQKLADRKSYGSYLLQVGLWHEKARLLRPRSHPPPRIVYLQDSLR